MSESLVYRFAAAAAKSLQSCSTLCDPIDGSSPGSPISGFSRQEHWSGLPFPSLTHESEKWKWSCSVESDSLWLHGLQLPGSSVHGIFQARVLEWGAIAFSCVILGMVKFGNINRIIVSFSLISVLDPEGVISNEKENMVLIQYSGRNRHSVLVFAQRH